MAIPRSGRESPFYRLRSRLWPHYRPIRRSAAALSRTAAYHQGTVWAWPIGPFLDAWLKVHPDDRAGTLRKLEGFVPHLGQARIGSISEVFDPEEPFTPRGRTAQAWSVAQALRCRAMTEAIAPTPGRE